MNSANNKILKKMLDRLLNSLMNGPSLNCRPHASRQRIDWMQVEKLKDLSGADALVALLSGDRRLTLTARAPAPKPVATSSGASDAVVNDSTGGPAERAWNEQRAALNKLRTIAEDAKTYEQDTGVHILNLGFPLLSLPPGSLGPRAQSATRRIIAPIAFIPVTVTVKSGVVPSVEIECRGNDIDLVVPNTALMAWIEQQTGSSGAELFVDEKGEDPWREINELVAHASKALGLAASANFIPQAEDGAKISLQLESAPRSDSEGNGASIVPAAVLGLFPVTNQGLLRDTRSMIEGESIDGPLQRFLEAEADLEKPAETQQVASVSRPKSIRDFRAERLICLADPCQAHAVKLSKTCDGLVIHGPPGTGKSQTIANIIGDHLARGERVLVVCDKRTALDVVFSRMDAMGLGHLCAIIHDPQRDQRDLYRSIREQLDALPDLKTDSRAAQRLEKADDELQRLHLELSRYHTALSAANGEQGTSFHDLVGEWLSIPPASAEECDRELLGGVKLSDLETSTREIQEALHRAQLSAYPTNKWVQAAGTALQELLAIPMEQIRGAMSACVKAADDADAARGEAVLPLLHDFPLKEQAAFRTKLGTMLQDVLIKVPPAIRNQWAKREPARVASARQKLAEVRDLIETVKNQGLEPELAAVAHSTPPSLEKINTDLASIVQYLAIASKWYAFAKPRVKKAATSAMAPYGLPVGRENAERVREFLTGMRARLVLQNVHNTLTTSPTTGTLLSDGDLVHSLECHAQLFELLALLHSDKRNLPLFGVVGRALTDADTSERLLTGLRASAPRAESIERLCTAMTSSRLFNRECLMLIRRKLCEGAVTGPTFKTFADQLPTLENVLRFREGVQALPSQIGPVIEDLAGKGMPAEDALPILRKAALANAISDRLRNDKQLQGMDGQRIKYSFERYRQLESEKLDSVRASIKHLWTSRQQERLLATTGSRMNTLGAEVRRRLMLRGQRALRLRQVIALGRSIEGGDPLFDLRPVWMASPETVAQLFPREAVFDSVIFDEASQCRLEEALPVLRRGRRLVVAGDPKQLPPTRFFESAILVSENEEIESGQELFEAQQSEVEDLLTGALNLDIQEAYLDVHYRSRNADLIGFSNEQFYDSRLQPIPGHPSNCTRYSPITLYPVNGVYEDTMNVAEADAVCSIVRDLLRRAEPPSIGIASFNTSQRDLIIDRLDALAETDREFGRRLDEARRRVGNGASAHLFVKNLENVQGDERDHIIISTTYGPDGSGRFFQRFGPLGRVGGGRRLNVLVTRAREELHLVTSIPSNYYRNLPPIPQGQTPGGGWLLYAFLRYAETLAALYEAAHRRAAELEGAREATVACGKTRSPSQLAQAFATHIAKHHRTSSTVYWGNDGFCVDLALHHPKHVEDVTIGVLCDSSRYSTADDPVAWDIFRTNVLESQGWSLHRVWSPHLFRDVPGHIDRIMSDVESFLAKEKVRDALPVSRPT